jgi:hypothetical protein
MCLNTGVMTEIEVPSRTDEDKWYRVLVQDPVDIEEVICECRGYEVRGHCSHQKDALDAVCGWKEREGPEKQTNQQRRDKVCPRCLGPTKWIVEVLDAD